MYSRMHSCTRMSIDSVSSFILGAMLVEHVLDNSHAFCGRCGDSHGRLCDLEASPPRWRARWALPSAKLPLSQSWSHHSCTSRSSWEVRHTVSNLPPPYTCCGL